MGITWKAMPLLSTLAALVIIVHSAEEDLNRGLDRDYRYDVRPRVLDTGTPSYDQPWKIVETEPMMQKSTQGDIWEDSPERPLRRRKPVRKRKRRPFASTEEYNQDERSRENQRSETFNIETPEAINPYPQASEDKHVVQRYHETDELIRYRDTMFNTEPTTEMPKRRRKRPEYRRNRWTEDYVDMERPLRRRAQRRKKPSVKNTVRLTEFGESRADEEGPKLSDYPEPEEIYPKEEGMLVSLPERSEEYSKEDRSLSEFSMEERGPRDENWSPQQVQASEDQSIKEQSTEDLETMTNFRPKNLGISTSYRTSKLIEKMRDKCRVPRPHKEMRIIATTLKKLKNNKIMHQKFLEKMYANYFSNDVLNNTEIYSNTSFNTFPSTMPFPKILSQSIIDKKHRDVLMPFFDVKHTLDQIVTDVEENMKLGERPIDPVTLKEILKRSNGTSLSEILQQHNLSLSDLLRGKDDVMSMKKNEDYLDEGSKNVVQENITESHSHDHLINEQSNTEVLQDKKEVISVTEPTSENNESIRIPEPSTEKQINVESQTITDTKQPNNETKENEPKIVPKRRTSGIRRKLRLRPSIIGANKSQLNRDLMAQTARKYHNSRNTTKLKEWKYVIPMMNKLNSSEEIDNKNEINDFTSTLTPEETTILSNTEYPLTITTQTETDDEEVDKNTTVFITTTQESTTEEVTTQEATTQTVFAITTTTGKPKISRFRPPASHMGLRRQAFNNRLKRKRMKQRNSTTESPVERDEYGIDLFGMPNLVSSSEFIARTQTPKPANTDRNEEDFTTLDDFMTTEKSIHAQNGSRFTRNSSIIDEEITSKSSVTATRFVSTTEETAKFEIEEILNDTRTSARLSRILMERNMTLNELVEHRERGSSHVHLADIFHNASKEPNPPEPFLSKSSIEPISKETYPLRAILEANLHEAPAKATTIDSIPAQTYAGNIPVVMDFGNNVNENGENMGIISLFKKFTDDISSIEESAVGKDSDGTPYVTTVITVNNTDSNETTARESRILKNEDNNLNHDVVAWSELFELMRKNHQNETDDIIDVNKGAPSNHQILLQDADGDGLIVLEDLQRLKNFDINNEEKLDINSYEADAATPGILDRSPSHTRSVTVATASIVGLAMILFLLTYAGFKWKQQRNLLRKKQNFTDDRIPTPVFENRKGHKNNSSTRSISPMLATSNIYTLNTLDSNGKESPDYMWDSLRKPFQ